jgi:hypothetical protein
VARHPAGELAVLRDGNRTHAAIIAGWSMTEKGLNQNSLDASAVERILAAVGKKFIPPDLDQLKLLMDLESCLATYRSAVQRRSDKPTKDRIDRLKSIQTAAEQFEEQLQPDSIFDHSDSHSECEYLHDNVKDLIRRLASEIEDLTFELQWGTDWREEIRQHVAPRALADRWKARSPFEWIAGDYLPEVFSAHFGKKATFHRRKGVPESPVLRFIERALIELGITRKSGRPYSRGSIAKALSDVRTRRFRR